MSPLILTFDQWLSDRDRWVSRGAAPRRDSRAGAQSRTSWCPIWRGLTLVGAEFPASAKAAATRKARLLRERWKFAGELRAPG